MALFGQSLQSGISFEQPVQQPNAFASIANVATAGLEMFSQSQRQDPKAEKDAAELANFQSWASQIDQADALRSQGRIREAESIEKKANRNFAVAGGDLGDKEVSSYYERITGRPWELSGSNPQEVTLNKVRASDSYRNAFFATFVQPNLTPEQRDQAALTTVAKNQAAEQAILNQTNTFQLGGVNPDDGFNTQADFMTLISSFREENIGALAAQAQAGQSVRPDQIQAAKARYAQFQSWVTANRPKGVSSDLWKPVQDTLDSLSNEIQIAEQLSAKVGDGLKADMTRNYLEAVKNSDNTDTMKWFLANSDPRVIAEYGVESPSEIQSALKALKFSKTSSNQVIGNPEAWSTFAEKAEGKDAPDALKESKKITEYWRRSGIVTPETQEGFFQNTAKAAANLHKMGSIDVTPAHSRELNTIFDGTIEAGLNTLDKTDPEKGRFLRGKLVEALDMQLNAAVEGVVGRSRGIFSVNLDTFSFDLDEDALIQRFKGRAGIVGEVPSAVKQAARAYGGDVLLMIEDNAAKVPTNPALAFFLQSSEVSNIRRSAMVFKDYMESARTLSNIKNRIGGVTPVANPDLRQPNALGGETVPVPKVRPPEGVPEARQESFVNRIVELEGFESTPYKLPGEKYYTVGFGHYGPTVDPNKTYTKEEAKQLLAQDLDRFYRSIEKELPEFSAYSPGLQTELVQAWYRGDFPRVSPKTLALIKEGRFSEAAEEFLNNEEYRNADQLGIPGIRPRMEAVAEALRSEENRAVS